MEFQQLNDFIAAQAAEIQKLQAQKVQDDLIISALQEEVRVANQRGHDLQQRLETAERKVEEANDRAAGYMPFQKMIQLVNDRNTAAQAAEMEEQRAQYEGRIAELLQGARQEIERVEKKNNELKKINEDLKKLLQYQQAVLRAQAVAVQQAAPAVQQPVAPAAAAAGQVLPPTGRRGSKRRRSAIDDLGGPSTSAAASPAGAASDGLASPASVSSMATDDDDDDPAKKKAKHGYNLRKRPPPEPHRFLDCNECRSGTCKTK